MKTGKLDSLLPAQSLVLLLLCGAGILVFVVLIILPSQRISAELDQEIVSLRNRIEEQKILSPVFKSLLDKIKAPEAPGLPTPQRSRLSRAEIPAVPQRLQDLALKHRLRVREVVPDLNSLTDASGRFMLQVAAAGRFTDVHGFLKDLGALPYFESIEEVDIRAAEGGEEMALKIWMARE